MSSNDEVPKPGHWPVDPQSEDVPLSKDRIWIDGCFDFSHHGHAGAMLQARRLGKELLVGVHSDEEILENKGPTVMTLNERVAAVEACRWATKSIPCAPYVTSLPWITHYGCFYVVHGDDITSDSSGEDCYRFVKAAGRFLVVKRTPGISTTDLVGRMLLFSRAHFIKSLTASMAGEEGPGTPEERKTTGQAMMTRMTEYASDETGLQPGSEVWSWEGPESSPPSMTEPNVDPSSGGSFVKLVKGKGPRPGQRIVYVDGGFDLFSSGHIEFLRQVHRSEDEHARNSGWYDSTQRDERMKSSGGGDDYGPAYVVAGVHDDLVINKWKGLNYPIMNIFERGLCVLQCRYIHAVIFSAPFSPTESYLTAMPFGGHRSPDAVYHGPTSFMPLTYDPYTDPKRMGIYRQIGSHAFHDVNAGQIVRRILTSREAFEERQRAKGIKGVGEAELKVREEMEERALEMEKKMENQK